MIFEDHDRPIAESAMGRGIVCGDGWYALIDCLCASLQESTDLPGEPQVVASQVKEKYDSLRFYVKGFASGRSEYQHGMISFAQSLSERICECCGSWKESGLPHLCTKDPQR